MADVVKRSLDVGIEHPFLGFVGTRQAIDFLDSIMAASSGAEPVATPLKPRFPAWFERVFDHCLHAAINHHRHPQSTLPHHPREFRDG